MIGSDTIGAKGRSDREVGLPIGRDRGMIIGIGIGTGIGIDIAIETVKVIIKGIIEMIIVDIEGIHHRKEVVIRGVIGVGIEWFGGELYSQFLHDFQ